MRQVSSLEIKGEAVSAEFKRKVADWENTGVLDQIAGKMDKALAELEEGDVK